MNSKKIEFNNGSLIETIEDSSVKRSDRCEEQLREQIQYWHQHPEEFIEFVYETNLSLYRKLLIKMLWRK